jgi:hydroxyacylglutathione hydrolase
MSLDIKKVEVGPWKENSYCIKYGSNSVLIDPGDEFELLLKEFAIDLSQAKAILLTHAHFDHIGAVSYFQSRFNLKTYLHSGDKKILHQANLLRKMAGLKEVLITPTINHWLDSINEINLLDKPIYVHHLPGHSRGSVSFEIEKQLFSGDIYFNNSIGRSDLPGGDIKQLTISLKLLCDRFEGYYIHPGHGESYYLNSKVIDEILKKI